jgi:polysaccharide export outer membrane protein
MNFKGLILFLSCFVCASSAWADSSEASYVLRPNDVISLTVYDEPDLSGEERILKTGQASFQLIGSVELGGLTVAAATVKIKNLYAKDYLIDPKVTLSVSEYATDFVSVLGSVKTPGQVPIPVSGHLDLAAAMATAGGLTETANTSGIQLIRAGGGVSNFTADSIQGAAGRVQLNSGDRIIVSESDFVGKTVTVLGEVQKPGPVPLPANGKLDLVNAIAQAGGLTPLANPKKVSITRKGTVTVLDFKVVSQRGDHPYLLQPEDVVTIAERLF